MFSQKIHARNISEGEKKIVQSHSLFKKSEQFSFYFFQILPGGDGKPQTVVRTKKVCVTPECSSASRRILSSINPERDPCDSFYEFACGGWMARNQPPVRRVIHSVMSQARDKMDSKLRGKKKESIDCKK